MPNPAKVLMVDDDQEIVRGASLRLQAAGYALLTAHEADAGIRPRFATDLTSSCWT